MRCVRPHAVPGAALDELNPRFAGRFESCPAHSDEEAGSALSDVDAVLAEHRDNPLRVVRSNHGLHALAPLEDEPDMFLRPVLVEVEPVA